MGVGVSANVPLYYILVLPLMFTCGMVLIDTTDGVVMRMAYGWAFLNPLRKVYYNLTVTIISVMVAWMIGSIELLQVLSTELNLGGGTPSRPSRATSLARIPVKPAASSAATFARQPL